MKCSPIKWSKVEWAPSTPEQNVQLCIVHIAMLYRSLLEWKKRIERDNLKVKKKIYEQNWYSSWLTSLMNGLLLYKCMQKLHGIERVEREQLCHCDKSRRLYKLDRGVVVVLRVSYCMQPENATVVGAVRAPIRNACD